MSLSIQKTPGDSDRFNTLTDKSCAPSTQRHLTFKGTRSNLGGPLESTIPKPIPPPNNNIKPIKSSIFWDKLAYIGTKILNVSRKVYIITLSTIFGNTDRARVDQIEKNWRIQDAREILTKLEQNKAHINSLNEYEIEILQSDDGLGILQWHDDFTDDKEKHLLKAFLEMHPLPKTSAQAPKEGHQQVYSVPPRRLCNFSMNDNNPRTRERAKKDQFVTNEELIKIYPMRFLPNSPFVPQIDPETAEMIVANKKIIERLGLKDLEDPKKQEEAIAITESGKHVILQQALKSCVPTCVAMLILDHGETPNYELCRTTNLANSDQAVVWLKKAKLESRISKIPEDNTKEFLSECLKAHGPGILGIHHPSISAHVVVLDEISLETNEAVIRDPFHGWMISVKLDALIPWVKNEDFIQITTPTQSK